MRIIAITIENTRAIFYALELNSDGKVNRVGEDLKSISINDDYNSSEMKLFKEKAFAYFDNISPDRIAILKRMTKGKFAAGSVSFKLEGLIQCYVSCDVEFVAPATLKAYYKKNEFTENPSLKYQVNAAQLAQFIISE